MHLRSVPLPGEQILLVVPLAIKTNFFPLKKCVVEVKNYLRSCSVLGAKVTEYDLILARAGKFNLSHEEVEKMVVFPAHRHNLGIYWQPRKSCQYPGQEGKKIALHCKNPINWQMAQEIREMFVQVGSRQYIFNWSVLTPLGYSLLVYINLLVVYRESVNLIGYITRRLSADSQRL